MQAMPSKLLKLLLGLGILVQTFSILGGFYWFFELFTHYAVYYAVVGSIFAVLSLLTHHPKSALIWTLMVSLNLAAIAPYLTSPTPQASENPTLTLLSQNFYYEGTDVDAFLRLVKEEKPDIVIVHEASDLWKTTKEKFRDGYPFMHITHETGIHGIFIASQVPGTFKEVPLGQHYGLVFTPNDLSYQVLAVHPTAPLTPDWAKDRNAQLDEIARLTYTSPVPVIVMGDFNSTPWSPVFKNFLDESGLKDSRLGFGMTPTWHAHNLLFKLPIDHALVSPGIEVQEFKSTEAIDSDHLGILLRVSSFQE